MRRVCYHAITEVQKEENMCPRYVWHRRRRLAAGKEERMWRVLQAVLPGQEHMLATNRVCGKPGLILVLDADFGGAAHGTVRWVREEGMSMEVLHVRGKDMKEYKKAGLHHAEFHRNSRIVEWCVYKWMMRRAGGQEDRPRWDSRMQKMSNEWVALWGNKRKRIRHGRGAEAQQERVVLDRGERDKARPGILLCAPLGLKGPSGKVQSKNGQWYDVHAERQHHGGGRTGGPVLEMHQPVASPEHDGIGVPDRDHAQYRRQGTVVGAGTAAAKGGAGG